MPEFIEVHGPTSGSRAQTASARTLFTTLLRYMKEECPINKSPRAKSRGGLRASLSVEVNEDGASFTANEYIDYILDGTDPHVIQGDQRPLAFEWESHLSLHGPLSGSPRRTRSGRPDLRSKPAPLQYMLAHYVRETFNRETASEIFHGGGSLYGNIVSGTRHGAGGRFVAQLVGKGRRSPAVPANSDSGNVVVWSVHHPGTKPNDFVSRAVDRLGPEIDNYADALGDEAADTIMDGFAAYGFH